MATSPLDLIRDGIEQGDWDLVSRGYYKMSGQKVSAPKQEQSASEDWSKTKKELNQLLDHMDSVLNNRAGIIETPRPIWEPDIEELDEEEEVEEDEENEEDEEEYEEFPDDDDDEELEQDIVGLIEEEDEDSDEDSYLMRIASKIKLPKKAPPNRKPATRVKVTCEQCERTESVPPALLPAVEEGQRLPYVCMNCKSGRRPRGAAPKRPLKQR